MVPETGQRKVFRDYLLNTPFEGDLYVVKGWKGGGMWRVTTVTTSHLFFAKFAAGSRKKLLLSSWYQFIRDGRVEHFTKTSPTLTGFQQACGDWLKLKEDGQFSMPIGARKSYAAGLLMGALFMAEGVPKK